ncbi:hypothetical protein HPB47_009176 [Ixodes persulcatus]|uniref:Uncharacterized protein n=1 Tax=Ixodes persulcatus TaxID=34615 RepID=A0AC60P2P1_IXOPE|nr:hypothetical protein HPB47_009176 [Ixodes persulcatus]
MLNPRLNELTADVAEEVHGGNGPLDEGDDEAAAYGWSKWRRRITAAFKKVAQAIVINKVAGEEYRLKQDLGKAFEKAGQWLQGNYTPETEDERKKLELLDSELEALIANAPKEDILDELDDEAAAYGLREVITGAAKSIVTHAVISKIASIIVGDEDLWEQDVGKAIEKIGQRLQGIYAAETEDELEALERLKPRLQELTADVAEEVYGGNGPLDEGDDEGEEYRLKQDLGKAFEKAGQWLQGNYTPETEDERKKLELLDSELDALIANAAKEDILDELDDEAAAYGWREVIAGAAKNIVKQVLINKITSIIVGAMG